MLFALTVEQRRHWLRVFVLIFGRDSFLGTPSDPRTFHQRALDEGRFYEERVAANLSNLVFGSVFPLLAKAIGHQGMIETRSGMEPNELVSPFVSEINQLDGDAIYVGHMPFMGNIWDLREIIIERCL